MNHSFSETAALNSSTVFTGMLARLSVWAGRRQEQRRGVSPLKALILIWKGARQLNQNPLHFEPTSVEK